MAFGAAPNHIGFGVLVPHPTWCGRFRLTERLKLWMPWASAHGALLMGAGAVRDLSFIIILLVITCFLGFFGLGKMALTDPDETFYAQTAKEMISRGEWVTPFIFGKPQFEKPIFYYWLVIISYMIFGITEFAARFPSAVFGIIGIIGTYYLGRLLFSKTCGFFAGLVLATSMLYVVFSRACVTDMVLTTFILLCMLFFLLGQVRGKAVCYIASSVMAALAVLTKGPIGLFIPAVVAALYITFTRGWKKTFSKVPLFWCIVVFLAVSLPWYIAVTRMHGSLFIDEFFGFHNVTRFLEAEHVIGTSPFFYIPVVIGGFYPWSIFFLFGSWDMYKKGEAASPVKSAGLFLAIWFLTVFLFFSLSSTKLVTYIFPLFPVMAVVTGRFWEKFLLAEEAQRTVRKEMNIAYSIFAATSFIALVAVYFVVKNEYPQALKGLLASELLFALLLAVSVLFFIKRKGMLSFASVILTIMVTTIPVIRYILPVVEEHESSKALSLKIKDLSKGTEPLGGECDHRRGIAFYADRTDIVDIHSYSDLGEFISRKERVWGIIQKKHYNQMKESKRGARLEAPFQSGEYVIITNKAFTGD